MLAHPYFREHHDILKEPDCKKRMPPDSRFKKKKKIREAIYEKVLEMNEAHNEIYHGINPAEFFRY